MNNWIKDHLGRCLNRAVTDDMMQKIFSIRTEEDFDNYFGNLLNSQNEEHRLFLLNSKLMLLRGKQGKPKPAALNVKKTNKLDSVAVKKNKTKTGKEAAVNKVHTTSSETAISKGDTNPKGSTKAKSAARARLGETILLKGRRRCDCQATEHALINNCLNCGRIVCEQENAGPCLFCLNDVFTISETLERLALAAERGDTEKKQEHAALSRALEHRDRLLDYERNSAQRTTVIDDEMDYFQDNSVWLTDGEREKFTNLKEQMQDKKHESRLNCRVIVDFAGREIAENFNPEFEAQILQQIADNSKAGQETVIQNVNGYSQMLLPSNLDSIKKLRFKPSKKNYATDKESIIPYDSLERKYNRVQDKQLLEMQDMRQCLSIHQPWASLLLAGIKNHEGRIWYSQHRGRLWIASTAREPRTEDIEEAERFYRLHYNDPSLKFPESYLTGSLLGCVIVEQCLPQEEYRDVYPKGESDSPYVFICTQPLKLPVPLPIQGGHKIFELPLKIHNTANKTLLRASNSKG